MQNWFHANFWGEPPTSTPLHATAVNLNNFTCKRSFFFQKFFYHCSSNTIGQHHSCKSLFGQNTTCQIKGITKQVVAMGMLINSQVKRMSIPCQAIKINICYLIIFFIQEKQRMSDNQKKIICEEINQDEPFNPELHYKIIIIGDSGVGKSCISMKGVSKTYNPNYISTVGFEYSFIHFQIDNKYVRLHIWDTCGQEAFHSIASNFYRSSSLAILVYSIACFYKLSIWLNELKSNSNSDMKVILVGNKSDLASTREVEYEEGKKFQIQNSLDEFMETSAKLGDNIKELFSTAVQLLYAQETQNPDPNDSNMRIDLSKGKEGGEKDTNISYCSC